MFWFTFHMLGVTFDFGPYFTSFVLLLWLGYPLLTAIIGFILYWMVTRTALYGRFSSIIAKTLFSVSIVMSAAVLLTVGYWLPQHTLFPLLPPFILLMIAIVGIILNRQKYKSLIIPFVVILLLCIIPIGLLFILNLLHMNAYHTSILALGCLP